MFSIKDESKIIKILLILNCGILFTLIIISIFHYGNSTLLGDYYNPNNDDVKFIRSARLLLEKGKYTYHKPPHSTVFMMPGLPFILSFLMLFFGAFGGITALRILQAIIQVLSLLLIFFISRKLFNSKVGIIAVILDVFCIWEIWVPNLVLTETFFKFFLLCLVFFSIYAIERNEAKYYIIGGIFLALATLFRPVIATYPILILIMWTIKKIKFKEALKYALIVLGVFGIIMSPWWIRNYIVFNRFIPFTLATGNPMLQGTFINNTYTEPITANDGINYKKYNTLDPSLSEIERNDMEVSLSKHRLKVLFPKEPFKYIRWYTISKSRFQMESPFYWKEIFGVKFSTAMRYHRILLRLGFLGAILYFLDRKKNRLAILPILVVMYLDLAYLPFFTMSRYFYPAMPLVIIFAAYFIFNIFKTVYREYIHKTIF